ncbi:hypothetical protein T265_08069 [Opisthorchis viverrini]|uniref:Uncharacterized protein n=1 Tax=Opisthorchis viverrini TaxID=6198 RepID=A0A075A9N6_OPIVI|nr:hypothetical protein T265_08069 [Opisthorchis viverrini]KER24224.1 hypothetical protein T265_08069 [Opisthorchis viverrini]
MKQSGAAHSVAWKHHEREIQLSSSFANHVDPILEGKQYPDLWQSPNNSSFGSKVNPIRECTTLEDSTDPVGRIAVIRRTQGLVCEAISPNWNAPFLLEIVDSALIHKQGSLNSVKLSKRARLVLPMGMLDTGYPIQENAFSRSIVDQQVAPSFSREPTQASISGPRYSPTQMKGQSSSSSQLFRIQSKELTLSSFILKGKANSSSFYAT